MRTYTVVGIFEDNEERFATVVEANTPLQAEAAAGSQTDYLLIVAAVFEGALTPVQ
jgi:hypothetical protein